MKIIRLPLRPYTRAHFGQLKIDHDLALNDTDNFAHSDTLFSALVHNYAKSPNTKTDTNDLISTEDFIKYFDEEQISISSLFYYLKNTESNTETIYLLPKPTSLSIFDSKTKGNHKERNRIEYISAGVWKNGLQHADLLDKSTYTILQDNIVVLNDELDKLGLQNTEKLRLFSKVDSPKSPQRGPENAAIFYQADVQIAGKPTYKKSGATNHFEIGWYFMYEAEGDAETALLKATSIMSYTGIGGEIHHTGRTPDKSPETDTLDIAPQESNVYCSLSLINPNPHKEELKQVRYCRTVMRGGRPISSEKDSAKIVRMIQEGAILNSNEVKGRLVELGTDLNGHTIWRNGKAFLVPCQVALTQTTKDE